MATAPPTNEIGAGASSGTLTWGHYTDDTERVPELRWPKSVKEFDRMRSDSQVHALYTGTTLPIRRYRYLIDPNGSSAAVYERLSEDMGLPIKGSDEVVDDTSTEFNHDDLLRHALLSLVYGHMAGEIVGEVRDGWWRMTKVSPRMPATIAEMPTEDDGMLKGIRQNIRRKGAQGGALGLGPIGERAPLIDITRLVMFTWEREGSNWAGRSMLRPLYGNWLLKQKLMRVDATKHERNGMGIPIAKAIAESVGKRALARAHQIATRIRAGKNVGGALPFGMDMKLMGVEGNIPDTLASIKYHDEAMARAMLMMFIQLGQTETGSRALGNTFVDFFGLALEAVADWYCKTITRYLFRRWVVWNVGENERTPKLVYDAGPREYSVEALKSLVDAKILTVDPELEGYIRGKGGLPRKPDEVPTPNPEGDGVPEPPADTTPPVEAGRRYRRVFASDDTEVPLPDRELRRQPYAHEAASATNFALLDSQYEDAIAKLVAAWQDVRAGQINELVDVIAQTPADDLDALSNIAVEASGADSLLDILIDVADTAAAGAVEEAKEQGVDATLPDMSVVHEDLGARATAMANLLARSLSEAAARKATSLAGGALEPDDIANEVRTYLDELSDAYLEDQFTGAVTGAQNEGRKKVMQEEGDDTTSIYASELLDTNTCEKCRAVDGTEYDSLVGATLDYPTGGFKDCKGGPRCRGTLVAVYGGEDN